MRGFKQQRGVVGFAQGSHKIKRELREKGIIQAYLQDGNGMTRGN